MSTSGVRLPKKGSSGEICLPFDGVRFVNDVAGVWCAAMRLEEGYGISVSVPGGMGDIHVFDNRGSSLTIRMLEDEIRIEWRVE